MLRRLIVALSIVACLMSVTCQNQTKVLPQSLARVDEAAVISTLRSIASAQRAYSLSNNGDYGTFPQLTETGYLDARFNSSKPVVRGYVLIMTTMPREAGASEASYSCNADPEETAKDARHFYIESGTSVIHVNASQPATANDESIQP
jgi:hypothetical protein